MNRPERKRFSRRDFLRAAAIGAGAGLVRLDGLGAAAPQAGGLRKKIPVGVQLYSVRQAASKDLPAVLEAIGVQRRDNLRADRRIDLRVGAAVKASPEGSPKREDVAFFRFICEMERREECHRRGLRPPTRILS